MVIDLDRHDGDPDEIATRNSEFAQHVYNSLVGLGIHPLLIDSNGRGGLPAISRSFSHGTIMGAVPCFTAL